MDNIIQFPGSKPNNGEYLSGEAVCVACGHTWEAVLPVGENPHELECLACKSYKGVLRQFVIPSNEYIWKCSCGSHLFSMTQAGVRCACCGFYQKFM